MVRPTQKAGRKPGRTKDELAGVLKLTRRMFVSFRERLDEELKPLGVTAAQLKLLAALDHEPGTSGAHLSRFCEVTPQTLHALLALAERRGWVRRFPHPENARTLLAELTPEGLRLFQRGKRVALRIQDRMLRTLSANEVHALEATLESLIENLG